MAHRLLSPERTIDVVADAGTFTFTRAELYCDGSNEFSRFLERERNARVIMFDVDEVPSIAFIAAYLKGEDIIGDGMFRARPTHAGGSEPLVVTQEWYNYVLADAKFLDLRALQAKLEELGRRWFDPLPPAHPMHEGRFSFFKGQPVSFARAVELGGLEGEPIEDIMKVNSGPSRLFQFSDLILSAKAFHRVDFWVTFRSHEIRRFLKSKPDLQFRHEDRGNATLKVAPSSHAASKTATVQVDDRPPERLHTFTRWLLSESDTEASSFPTLERHLGYVNDTLGRPALQVSDFYAPHALGFWRKNELHIVHWVIEGGRQDWTMPVKLISSDGVYLRETAEDLAHSSSFFASLSNATGAAASRTVQLRHNIIDIRHILFPAWGWTETVERLTLRELNTLYEMCCVYENLSKPLIKEIHMLRFGSTPPTPPPRAGVPSESLGCATAIPPADIGHMAAFLRFCNIRQEDVLTVRKSLADVGLYHPAVLYEGKTKLSDLQDEVGLKFGHALDFTNGLTEDKWAAFEAHLKTLRDATQ